MTDVLGRCWMRASGIDRKVTTMNSSPVNSWQDFIHDDLGVMYTFWDSPWAVKGLCLLVLMAVVWFIFAAYRFEGHGREQGPK